MRLIDADELNFKGRKYNTSQMKAIHDFIDVQPTAYDIEKARADAIDEVTDELLKLPKIFVDYFDYIAVARITKKLEQLKEQK